MTNRKTLLATLVLLSVVIGCGDDDDGEVKDAGADASDDASQSEGGKGGSGGKGGAGGSAGASGSSGKGGEGGSSGEGGAGGSSGEGGAGGAGGSGPSTYSVGGQVSGLLGDGLVLQNNGGNDLTVDESGAFTFSEKLDTDEDYAVTVKTQPSSPTQACTVAMGTGKVGTANVTNVQVNCATNKYTIGGSITGLTGSGLKLKNNGGDELTASGTSFTFATSLDSGAAYAVTISAQPSGQVCGIASGSGNVGSENVTNVAVTCYSNPVLAVEPSFGSAIATWGSTNGVTYTLKGTTDGACDLTNTSCANAVEVANAATPATVSNLTDGTVYYFQLVATAGGVTAYSNKTATRPNSRLPNGSVNALATSNDVTYAGGAFNRVSVHTGAAVPVHKTTGFPSELPNFPIVHGDVYAVAADGSGGYYVGGAFQLVDDQGRAFIAHIKSDGTLDSAWNPGADGIVDTIAVHNNTVYVAGAFTTIGGQNRAGFAAIAAADGVVSQTFNPNPTGGISAIAFWQDNVVVGGSFTNIASTAQARLAMLNPTNGALVAWAPNPDDSVYGVAVDGDTVYVAGEFRNIGSVSTPRDRLAAINATGIDAAKVTSWDPGANNGVYTLTFANNTAYVAGLFTSVGSASRAGLAAIGADGTVKGWDPMIAPSNNTVGSIEVSADTVYIGGSFATVGGMARSGVAALSTGDTATLQSWNPNPDGNTTGLALVGNSVVIGGVHRGIRGVVRKHLFAFDATGKLTTWAPEADNTVNAIAVGGSTIYVGGDFGTLGGSPRGYLGALDNAGGLTAWNPNVDGSVNAIAVSNDTVYAGGDFTKGNVGANTEANRSNLAAFSQTAPGAVTSWNPGASEIVRALALNGTTLYVGGDFTTLGGATRNHLGAVPTGSDTATSWDPNINDTTDVTINAIAATADAVYAGGKFAAVGAGATVRTNFAAFDTTGGAALALQADPDDIVRAVLVANNRLSIAGDFFNVGTSPVSRSRYAEYEPLDATPMLETANDRLFGFDLSVRALSAGSNNVIFAGGDFTRLNGEFRSGYAVLNPTP